MVFPSEHKPFEIPEVNNLTIGILVVLAQEERELISQRTKLALEVLKSKGVQLGNQKTLPIIRDNEV